LIRPEIIQRVRDTADIVEVVGEFVQLKKSGQSYKGLSPFTDEKTPSFFVSPAKGIFKCFSTSRGGDSIKFIMELEGLSYIESIRFLAQKYNIELEEEVLTKEALAKKDKRESIFIVLNFAKEYFKNLLHNSEDGQAIGLSYFKERGFDEKITQEFELGFSANHWDGLIKEAVANHYSLELLEAAGLIIRKDTKTYDRFRNRVMFPIHNLTGKVIAFGARILIADKKQPKYLNSPETDVYHKSDILFGIYQAKNHLRNEDNCYLVEGYTDVISLHQSGIRNVVASSGTSLTKGQIKVISRYTKNITVLYDGDSAGIKASIRGIDMLLEEGLNVHAITFPEGQDPDSYCQELGGIGFRDFLEEERVDFITFKTRLFLNESKNDPLKKASVIREIIESIAKIPDSIKRTVYFKESANLLGIEEKVLIDEFNKIFLKQQEEKSKPKKRPQLQLSEEEQMMDQMMAQEAGGHALVETLSENEQVFADQEKEIVRLLMNFSTEKLDENQLFGEYLLEEIKEVEIHNPLYKKIVDEFREAFSKETPISSGHFLQHENVDIQNATIGFLATEHEISVNWEEKHQLMITNEIHQLGKVAFLSITRLKWRKIRVMSKDITEEIRQAEKNQDHEKAMLLLEKILFLKKAEREVASILGIVING
jgi:DNA primase